MEGKQISLKEKETLNVIFRVNILRELTPHSLKKLINVKSCIESLADKWLFGLSTGWYLLSTQLRNVKCLLFKYIQEEVLFIWSTPLCRICQRLWNRSWKTLWKIRSVIIIWIMTWHEFIWFFQKMFFFSCFFLHFFIWSIPESKFWPFLWCLPVANLKHCSKRNWRCLEFSSFAGLIKWSFRPFRQR